MPVITHSTYRSPKLFTNGHLQTIYPHYFRPVNGVSYKRIRISTPDDDFLDLDWSYTRSGRVAIITHGLEGNSNRTYVMGMVKALNRRGWDTCSINLRGCSGVMNNKPEFYHSGATYDLKTVIGFVDGLRDYDTIALVGFSLGGNITLRYLGEEGSSVPSRVTRAVAISVPVDLGGSAAVMAGPSCRIYMIRFLRQLRAKVKAKMRMFPGIINDDNFDRIKTFYDFDDRYTAPLHGYSGAEDYYNRASSLPVLEHIRVASLLINADNDPFLSPDCYPRTIAENSRYFHFEQTRGGGHVGFVSLNNKGVYWSEERTAAFLEE